MVVALPFRDAEIEVCIFDPCGDEAKQRGLCWGHLAQFYQKGELRPKRGHTPPRTCDFPGCENRHAAKGLCFGHRQQVRTGRELKPLGRPPRKPTLASGYVKVWDPDHPNAQARGYVMEHIAVMSELIGRPLVDGENVHHKNGDRADNRPENLELWSTRQPKGQRVEDKVAYAIEILRTYSPESLRPELGE